MGLFDQNNEIIYYKGQRMVKCKVCGKIDNAENFSCYGGVGQLNKGTCTACARMMDGYKER